MQHDTRKHDTTSERTFLNGIGTHAGNHSVPRSQLLVRYLKTMQRREHWEGINRQEIERHCLRLIELERVG